MFLAGSLKIEVDEYGRPDTAGTQRRLFAESRNEGDGRSSQRDNNRHDDYFLDSNAEYIGWNDVKYHQRRQSGRKNNRDGCR